MKNTNCIHCQLSCKQVGKTECETYKPISGKPEQLQIEIKNAFKEGNYEKGKELQDQLFKFNYGGL